MPPSFITTPSPITFKPFKSFHILYTYSPSSLHDITHTSLIFIQSTTMKSTCTNNNIFRSSPSKVSSFITYITLALVFLSSSPSSFTADAFLSPSLLRSTTTASTIKKSTTKSTSLNEGRIEQIEFKIYPDGRIEESVRGIKGGECHKVTEEINQSLGKVIDSKPTEEMYEQEIVIDQTIEVQNGNGNDSGGWDGASSW